MDRPPATVIRPLYTVSAPTVVEVAAESGRVIQGRLTLLTLMHAVGPSDSPINGHLNP